MWRDSDSDQRLDIELTRPISEAIAELLFLLLLAIISALLREEKFLFFFNIVICFNIKNKH